MKTNCDDRKMRSLSISRGGLVFFVVFFVVIFLKLVLFNYLAFKTIMVSSFWTHPTLFWAFYLPKLGIAVLLASFCFLFKGRIWTLVSSVVLDLWLFAQLVYVRANDILLDAWSITMAGNMDGFWKSVMMYIEPVDFLIVFLTAVLCLSYLFIENSVRIPSLFLLVFFIGWLCNVCGAFLTSSVRGVPLLGDKWLMFCINPMDKKVFDVYYGNDATMFCQDFSAAHFFLFQFILIPDLIESESSIPEVDLDVMKYFCDTTKLKSSPSTPLILCLVESLENWAITEDVMPHLYHFINSGDGIFYAPNLKTQRRNGSSADGQMIVETGLLPIQDGAVCFRYHGNTFPSLNSLYHCDSSATLIPHNLSVWNQAVMSRAYDYDTNYVCSPSDSVIFSELKALTRHYRSILTFNLSSHNPFDMFADKSTLDTPEDMPVYMANYLKSLNYVDAGMGFFLDEIRTDSLLKNSTIVITSDHQVLSQEKRIQFCDFCTSKGLEYNPSEPGIPCVIYSPNIDGCMVYRNPAYQMDIYPTVLGVLDASYYWKGFGADLINSDPDSLRVLSESELFILSDSVIRSDWFNRYRNIN